MDRTQIAVIGAGAAGLAAALALARQRRDVTLIGPSGVARDGRTVALLQGSVRFLTHLGLGDALMRNGAPLRTMRIVDDTGSLFRPPPVAFRASEIGLPAFGTNIENADLVEAMTAALSREPSVRHIAQIARQVTFAPGGATITLADGTDIVADLVVAADGRQSPARTAAGIGARSWDYGQTALAAIFRHTLPHDDTSTELHTRQGPFTLVPLPGGRSSLVWMMQTQEADRVAGLDDADFARAAERQAHFLLGEMALEGRRGRIPMTGLSVQRFTGPRITLVGEAAHVFPPIGAQGLNLGLRDVAALYDALDGKRSAADPDALARYEAGRRRDVSLRTGAVDALNRSLLSTLLPVDLARGAGLLALDLVPPLRRRVMRQGLAQTGDGAPSLMRA